jgi:hypothetical protein
MPHQLITRMTAATNAFRRALLCHALGCGIALAGPDEDVFSQTIRPLLDEYCITCHSTEDQEGELDLERFDSLAAIARDPGAWELVEEQLVLGEMPPKKKPQPTPEQKEQLHGWVRERLAAIARSHAGDPGPVVLRRLSNAEYSWTVRDLTGIATLDPAREFPVDGAAGEGFTNAGAALVMSPGLVTKYLDAAKEIARHAQLLPDGIRFSPTHTRSDWTEETLAEIRAIYARHTVPGDGMAVDLQGIRFSIQDGGVLPLEKYFAATFEAREGRSSLVEIAREKGLSAKYLGVLWESLNDTAPSLLLDPLRARWRRGTIDDAPALAAAVKAWQRPLFRFHPIGHIGKRNGPKAWQEAVSPLAASREIRLKFPADARGDLTLSLVTTDAGDGTEGDQLVWENPRLLRGDLPALPLRTINLLDQRIGELKATEIGRTAAYLDALAESRETGAPLASLAARGNLHPGLLAKWDALLGITAAPAATGHFTGKIRDIAGHAELRGWGSPETPSMMANAATETIRFNTLTLPGRGVFVHPSPTLASVIYWRSPITGMIRLAGEVADADATCGNGVVWQVEVIRREGASTLAAGAMDNGGSNPWSAGEEQSVVPGDLVKLTVNPRDGQYICDTTQVALTLTETGDGRVWDLAKDVVDRVHDGNPLADTLGHAAVWHFCAGPDLPAPPSAVPAGSLLARWRDDPGTAPAVQELLLKSQAPAGPDGELLESLLDVNGPLGWLELAAAEAAGRDLEAGAPGVLEFKIPAAWAKGAEFVATARLKGSEGSVQMRATLDSPGEPGLDPGLPILVNPGSAAAARIHAGLDAFRELFPAALCYSKIVPIDEVVTLRLFHREDGQLRRLLLDDLEAAELDRLWTRLDWVSLAPLRLVDAFEQLAQYATQGGDATEMEPLREPILRDAARFRDDLAKAEPRHLDAVIDFAGKAWRRPLAGDEAGRLRQLYRTLRGEDLDHEAAIRLCLARVLTAPAFLYKPEQPGPGKTAVAVNPYELATRLSYFLWSSVPDEVLLDLAASGKLADPDHLSAEVRRMIADPRVRRLAIEFGAQWLHTRDFDRLDEKSERVFPEFAAIRPALHEEPIRFFTDLFQHDRPVLDLLEADHTFVNGTLAAYYGIPGISGDEWQRVEGVRARGRGGVLGFGATLARQSGASRTSPILRGNWICETLLGERLPPPPKGVPTLPDELPAGLSERELTARHSSDPTCARCHVRIDPFGFALENFDAIGRHRVADAAGLPVDASAITADGTEFTGIDGLRAYLLDTRRDDFVRQFCRKLLGYALGRGVQLSDAPLLDAMQAELAAGGHRVGIVLEQIVRSPQFREIRGAKHSDPDKP